MTADTSQTGIDPDVKYLTIRIDVEKEAQKKRIRNLNRRVKP
jgi:hypothetical protein